MTRGMASVILTNGWAVKFFGRVGVKVTLKELLEIFKSLVIKVALTVMKIILDMVLGKSIKENDFCFGIVKLLFMTTIKEFNSMRRFLEGGVKRLRGHVMRLLFATMYVMEKTVIHCNEATRQGNIIKATVANLEESASLVCFIIIFQMVVVGHESTYFAQKMNFDFQFFVTVHRVMYFFIGHLGTFVLLFLYKYFP